MTVGENIRRLRKEKGLTQKQLGELCGINEANIRKYELGGANPKLETLQKIATALNAHAFDFLDSDLFDALDDGNDADLFSQKIALIENDSTLSNKQKKRLIANLIMQGDVMLHYHTQNIDIATKSAINMLMDKLNPDGQNKALDLVELLTEIPKYRKEETE